MATDKMLQPEGNETLNIQGKDSKTEKTSTSKQKRKTFVAITAVAGAAGAGLLAYFSHSHYFPSTNDAYVQAYTINVSPYVQGYIKTIKAVPNKFVKKGTLLYEIVPLPFQLTVKQKEMEMEAAIHKKASLAKQLLQAQQGLNDQAARQWLIDLNDQRYKFLEQRQVVSLEKSQEFEASKQELKAEVNSARLEIERIKTLILEQEGNIKALRAAVNNAKVNLNYTRYYAPIDAYVNNNFSIRPGQYVKPGDVMFKLVDNTQWWVDANFMESQIGRIRRGMPAKITLDMYPGVKFSGNVITISQGSGAYYSLLPPQNATGNWVKVPQRFPVQIKLQQNSQHPLRAGSTARAEVNTL